MKIKAYAFITAVVEHTLMLYKNDFRKEDIKVTQEKQFMRKLAQVLAEESLISQAEKTKILRKIKEDDTL